MSKLNTTNAFFIAGIAAGALSPTVVTIQVLTREGFDLATHPLSLLSLGELGWIQISNFIVSGLLFVAFAVGLRRAWQSSLGGLWSPLLIGFYGLVLVGAGIFTVDPMLGFPPGTPDGFPETLSLHAQLHNATFIVAFLGLIAAQFVVARRFAAVEQRGFAIYCIATGLVTPVLIVLSQMTPAATGYILFGTGILANVWFVLLAAKMIAERRIEKVVEEEA